MNKYDTIALIIFFVTWLGYEPILKILSMKAGLITKDLTIVRNNWMKVFMTRSVKIFDSNLLGHSINSATFFASGNLIIIAAIAGAIFEGHLSSKVVSGFGIEGMNLQIKLGLVLLCLSRGFLNFIWGLRQMNYCAAALGACPENLDEIKAKKYAQALSDIIEPAMSNFSQGVRGYYFSLAAGAWLYGPIFLALGSIGAFALLAYRQSRSQAAHGLHKLRELLDEEK